MRSGAGSADTAPRSRSSAPPSVGLADDSSPLPLKTNICLPSRLKMAPVGYQPVGTKPVTKLRALLLTSTTATALVSAFDTSSVRSSGERASELGVEVGGAFGNRLIEFCSRASPENVSNTQTEALLPQATNRRLPSGESASAFGCPSVRYSSSRIIDGSMYTWTRAPPHSDTYRKRPSTDTTQLYGSAASVTVFVTWPVA